MDVAELIRRKALLRGLSQKTILTYIYIIRKFLRTIQKGAFEVTKNDIENHCLRLLERNASGNTLNVHLNALKFFYERVLGRKLTVDIRYTKVPKQLPEFLTKEETQQLFDRITNPKHLLQIKLMYSAGLRVGELLNLRKRDLQLKQGYGWVRGGKGNKDRIFLIAKKLQEELASRIESLSPEDYLFSNQGKKMSTQTVRLILKRAIKMSGITKNVHPHTLRHSFATHLLENGYSVMEVQPLLGHTRIDTTLIYTHLARPKLLNIESPLDSLEDKT